MGAPQLQHFRGVQRAGRWREAAGAVPRRFARRDFARDATAWRDGGGALTFGRLARTDTPSDNS
jgi:hypothetical protein